jgi:peptide/nickel transport system permease protein
MLSFLRRQGTLKLMLSSNSGRIGVALFLSMVVISLVVVAVYPLDFGKTKWNNPAYWADNPTSAPPSWWRFFTGADHIVHHVHSAGEPSAVDPRDTGPLLRYNFSFDASSDAFPSFTSLSLSGVTYYSTPPVVTLRLRRPDDRLVTVLQEVVRGPQGDGVTPVTRFEDTPFRVFLSGNDSVQANLADFLFQEFGLQVQPSQLQGSVESVLFGTPQAGGGFVPLRGDYTSIVDVQMRDARDSTDAVDLVKFVRGGTVYGLMGTDAQGRDLFTGLLFGFPVALTIGISTALISSAIGAALGIISGYRGGKTDIIIQRAADVFTNIPLLPILIFLIFVLGAKLWLVVLILALFGWPGLTITTRSMVLQIRSGQLVEATQALGASQWRIMFRHVIFQIAPFLLAQVIFFTPAAILAEAGLSFLGLGDPSIPTWGQILESGFRTGAVFVGYWWWVLPPGILIAVTALCFVLLTMALEPVVSPRLRTGQ